MNYLEACPQADANRQMLRQLGCGNLRLLVGQRLCVVCFDNWVWTESQYEHRSCTCSSSVSARAAEHTRRQALRRLVPRCGRLVPRVWWQAAAHANLRHRRGQVRSAATREQENRHWVTVQATLAAWAATCRRTQAHPRSGHAVGRSVSGSRVVKRDKVRRAGASAACCLARLWDGALHRLPRLPGVVHSYRLTVCKVATACQRHG